MSQPTAIMFSICCWRKSLFTLDVKAGRRPQRRRITEDKGRHWNVRIDHKWPWVRVKSVCLFWKVLWGEQACAERPGMECHWAATWPVPASVSPFVKWIHICHSIFVIVVEKVKWVLWKCLTHQFSSPNIEISLIQNSQIKTDQYTSILQSPRSLGKFHSLDNNTRLKYP